MYGKSIDRCDGRLKPKTEGSTRLTYTGGLEHLKIETRLINKMFTSVMGECVTHDLEGIGVTSMFNGIHVPDLRLEM